MKIKKKATKDGGGYRVKSQAQETYKILIVSRRNNDQLFDCKGLFTKIIFLI